MLAQKEQARLQVLNSLLAEHVSLDQAATLMGVSARHTRRILAACREEGAAALAHGNRGLRSTNATLETTKAEVLRLARSRYPDANHSHLSELLREREGIEIGRTTLRRILVAAGLKSPRRRRPPRQHGSRRQRPRPSFAPALVLCRCSMIMSGCNCSMKMSVHERIDIDDQRADEDTGSERSA